MDCDDDTHDSASGEKKLPLNSKDIGEPANVTSNIRVAVEENKQSTGSDSLQDSHNIRKKSESDVINTEGSDINYNESEGMEVEKSRSTEESHNVKQAVTNENVTSKKAKSKEFEELNIKEKGEHDETHDRQKKETSDKEEKELEDNHDKKKEEVNEVSKKKKTDIKDIRDKKKNEIENAIDNKLKEIEKMCYGERNETELSDKEKTEIEKAKVELSDSGKKAEKMSEGGQKVNTRKGFLVRTGSEEYDVDVNETNPYPDHINFVDVDAPNCDSSPMVIDTDGDSNDEIVMIGRKKGTRQYRTSANKEKGKTGVNSNRDSSPEVVLQEKFCKRRQEIVINLDDDNDDIEIETIKKKKKKKKLNAPKGVCCCNIECSTPGQDLRSAPVFVLTYYGRKYKKGRAQKVCAVCFEVAMQHYEHLSYLLSQHKPLMTAKFPPRNDTVVLTDSEEGSEEEEPLPDDVLEDLKEKLQEVIESTLEKYDFNYQIEASRNIISNKLDELSVAFRETDDMFTEMQKRMDDLRNEVYKDFVPIIQELPPLIIDDIHCDTSPPVMHLSPPRMMDYFRQQPQYRQQKTLRIKQTSSTPVTPPGLQKQHMGITSPSTSGTGQADTVRKSPIAGVATKKVTQIQRSVLPASSHPEVRQEDVVALEQVEVAHKPLPPVGALLRPKLHVGDVIYVMKLSFYGVWARAKILEVIAKGSEVISGSSSLFNSYKVKFESSYRKSNPVKQVSGKQMAYVSPSPVRFPVGTRVIAVFQDNDWSKECYYSGVIAEPPKSMNKYRYLVFFDDGYAQYVTHEKILLVCESSRNVWDDIHPDSREFIRKYLEQYPERPMVKLQQGQIVKTEWNGKWWIARVVEVDGSLVKMHFDADGRTEWIYRGSTRLGPLYAELAHAAARKEQGTFSRHRGLGVASLKKRNMPYVEYTRGTDGEEMKREDSGVTVLLLGPVQDGHGQSSETVPSRAVAKKSTTRRPDSNVDRMQDQQQVYPGVVEKSPQQPQGRVEYLQLKSTRCQPKKFEPHQCGPNCLNGTWYDPWAMKGENPLVIPMLCAWERQLNRCRGKRMVMYKAPCGRRLRNMEELHRYLRLTKSNMAVDLFDFDFWVHSFAEFVLERGFSNIKDLSYGSEHVAVPCVNCVDHSMPDYVTYSTKREPTDGVDLNLDPEFLIGCECTDDCQDRDKCACWQLTIQGTAYGPGGVVDPTVGYFYRRLPEPVMTGIYECNSRCKCSRTCLNRVAQQPLQLKLQVFKTENRGWGIRCLNDIPQGGFICIYAGRLLTEQGANEEGKNYGDEYLAELDYIEVVEKLKEGYESDVVQDDSDSPSEEKRGNEARSKADSDLSEEEEEEEEGETSQDARDSDEEFQPAPWEKDKGNPLPEQSSIRTRLRNRNSRHGSFDSQNDPKDKESDTGKEKEADRDSDKASSEDRDSRKKASQSLSSIDHMYSDDEDSQLLRLPSRFAVVSEPKESDKSKRPRNQSVREFFGNEEYCYIMDAKNNGNIGRYLNHSCSPNVFVQNVFVDTHDLRFPWVAFFALTYIHAGTELTWDYNYDVGSVPGKVLHCYCGSNDCRGRLL